MDARDGEGYWRDRGVDLFNVITRERKAKESTSPKRRATIFDDAVPSKKVQSSRHKKARRGSTVVLAELQTLQAEREIAAKVSVFSWSAALVPTLLSEHLGGSSPLSTLSVNMIGAGNGEHEHSQGGERGEQEDQTNGEIQL